MVSLPSANGIVINGKERNHEDETDKRKRWIVLTDYCREFCEKNDEMTRPEKQTGRGEIYGNHKRRMDHEGL